MKTILNFICLLIILFSFSCVSPYPNWAKVTDFNRRINLMGFSILPPNSGNNWRITNKTEVEINFSGQNKKTGSTLAAFGSISHLPAHIKTESDFIEFFKQYREFYSDPNRYEILKHDEIVEKNDNIICIQYHLLIFDKTFVLLLSWSGLMSVFWLL